MFDATSRFLNAQFEIMITLYVQVATLIVHIFLCFFFVKVIDGREIGAAMATNVTYILNLVSLELYCYCSPSLKNTFLGLPDRRAFHNICTYLTISVPAALLCCFEWWCFEILAIFAGLISVESLAAQVILINIANLLFMVPLGTSYAASAFTGYFLGQKKIEKAKKYGRLTITFNILLIILILIIMESFHK